MPSTKERTVQRTLVFEHTDSKENGEGFLTRYLYTIRDSWESKEWSVRLTDRYYGDLTKETGTVEVWTALGWQEVVDVDLDCRITSDEHVETLLAIAEAFIVRTEAKFFMSEGQVIEWET